jgi:restriction endonuclease Mrr
MAIIRVFTTHIGNIQTEAILDAYAKMEDSERAKLEAVADELVAKLKAENLHNAFSRESALEVIGKLYLGGYLTE